MYIGGYKIRNQNEKHFITFAVVEWVDVFTRSVYSDIVVESMQFCITKKGLRLHAWIIMPNHIHLIGAAKKGYKLSDILRDFKKHTSVKIIDSIRFNESESRKNWMLDIFSKAGSNNSRNSHYQFWRQMNHPIELNSKLKLYQRLHYLHNNPVKAKIVKNSSDYVYSSAGDYQGQPGLIQIQKI